MNIDKRLQALEAKRPRGGAVDLDSCTDDELDRLEVIAERVAGGLAVEALDLADVRLIASLRIVGE